MSVHIIGGGVVGLCTAWFLNKKGVDVTVIDRDDCSKGTSFGNAGMIVPSHFIPMASPGVIAKGLKWMFKSTSPFYIKPQLNWSLLQWLWKFYKSCNEKHVKKSIPLLLEFNQWSKSIYDQINDELGSDVGLEHKGLLMLYRTKSQEVEEIEMAEEAHSIGVDVKVLSCTDVQTLEKDVQLDVRGGIYFPGDAHIHPGVFMRFLKKELEMRGVEFIKGEIATIHRNSDRISKLVMRDGSDMEIDKLIVTAGSWTSRLLKSVGVKLLLQPGKGYSFTQSKPSDSPGIPTILTEAKVAVTPMLNQLRVGGTLELGQFSSDINTSRLKGIYESINAYYPNLRLDQLDHNQVWMGYRPCSPDGLPFIGQLSQLENTYVGTGHGMMGMSLGPATGKLLSELFLNNKVSPSYRHFNPNRSI